MMDNYAARPIVGSIDDPFMTDNFHHSTACNGTYGIANGFYLSIYLFFSLCPSVTGVNCDKAKDSGARIIITHEGTFTHVLLRRVMDGLLC